MIKAQTNNGAGPEILEGGEENAHAYAVRATLAEHKEHLENVKVCINLTVALAGKVIDYLNGCWAAISHLRDICCCDCSLVSSQAIVQFLAGILLRISVF